MSKGYFDDCMTTEQLEQEHRRLVIKMHPDRNPDNPNATAEFQEMQQQYEERKAELNGDYTKSARGRERRERERREREERERKERERNRLAEVLEQARKNKQKRPGELKAGDYVYAKAVEWMQAFSAEEGCANDVLRMAIRQGVKDETVVKIEALFDITDEQLMESYLSYATDGEIYGGWETIQQADPASGIRKAKRVAKVVMFRSPNYCIFGNPKGDQLITDYYLPVNYETMFSDHLHRIQAGIEREQREAERIEAERKARIEAEQRPLIEEWAPKLIAISRGLTDAEQQTVAVSNLKAVLRGKFPGVTFTVKSRKSSYGKHQFYELVWEDGPTVQEVTDVERLFDPCYDSDTFSTPWTERFGKVLFESRTRKMNVLTKARILQQLGGVVDAFCQGDIDDEVTVSDDDWTMLHLMVGVSTSDPDATLCRSTLKADGTRRVHIGTAVRYVFERTSYVKPKTTKKKVKQAA
jgi:curved DNA-binding protein CbpA